MNTNQLIEQQKQLNARLVRQEYALNEKKKQLDIQRAQVEEKFGTTDINELRNIYKRLKSARDNASTKLANIQRLSNQALDLIEAGEMVPADLAKQLEESVANFNNQSKIEPEPKAVQRSDFDFAPDVSDEFVESIDAPRHTEASPPQQASMTMQESPFTNEPVGVSKSDEVSAEGDTGPLGKMAADAQKSRNETKASQPSDNSHEHLPDLGFPDMGGLTG